MLKPLFDAIKNFIKKAIARLTKKVDNANP
jgi:hypothetical protein